MLSYEDIILRGEALVLVIQEHMDGRCWCEEINWPPLQWTRPSTV
jgi:hypothetical protein